MHVVENKYFPLNGRRITSDLITDLLRRSEWALDWSVGLTAIITRKKRWLLDMIQRVPQSSLNQRCQIFYMTQCFDNQLNVVLIVKNNSNLTCLKWFNGCMEQPNTKTVGNSAERQEETSDAWKNAGYASKRLVKYCDYDKSNSTEHTWNDS